MYAIYIRISGPPQAQWFTRKSPRTQKHFRLMVMLYHSKRRQIKISERKGALGRAQETRHNLPGVPFQQTHLDRAHLPLPAKMCDLQRAANQRISPEPWCPGLLLGVSLRNAAPTWLTSDNQSPVPPGGQSDGVAQSLRCVKTGIHLVTSSA